MLSSASKAQGDVAGLEGKKKKIKAKKNLKRLFNPMKHLTNLSINDCVSEPGNANSEPVGAQHRAASVGSAPHLCRAQTPSRPSWGHSDAGQGPVTSWVIPSPMQPARSGIPQMHMGQTVPSCS